MNCLKKFFMEARQNRTWLEPFQFYKCYNWYIGAIHQLMRELRQLI